MSEETAQLLSRVTGWKRHRPWPGARDEIVFTYEGGDEAFRYGRVVDASHPHEVLNRFLFHARREGLDSVLIDDLGWLDVLEHFMGLP